MLNVITSVRFSRSLLKNVHEGLSETMKTDRISSQRIILSFPTEK